MIYTFRYETHSVLKYIFSKLILNFFNQDGLYKKYSYKDTLISNALEKFSSFNVSYRTFSEHYKFRKILNFLNSKDSIESVT